MASQTADSWSVALFLLHAILVARAQHTSVDPSGYVAYCPCMGRFGNQADHFLGALAFAHGLNRTLVLPPWVEYGRDSRGAPNVEMHSFDEYFSVNAVEEYHRVILMSEFMADLAPQIWPVNKRIGHMTALHARTTDVAPSPFWAHSSVNMIGSVFYGHNVDSYDVHVDAVKRKWMKFYPPSTYPVLAFTGAPADFPVTPMHRPLHQYLRWSDTIAQKARDFLGKHVRPAGAAVIGVHFRNDRDWDNVCKMTSSRGGQHLFASRYCLGDNFEHGQLTGEVCAPHFDTIVHQLRKAITQYSARYVFVAADKSHMMTELRTALNDLKVTIITREPDDPHVSLAILASVDYYIGNCVSSFSNFASRERWVRGMKYGYWGVKDVDHRSKPQTPPNTVKSREDSSKIPNDEL